MRLAQIYVNNEIRLCAFKDGKLIYLSGKKYKGKALPRNLNEAIEKSDLLREAVLMLDFEKEPSIPAEKQLYAPAVPSGGKILLVGLNYKDHASECDMKLPEYPVLFSKYQNTLCGHNAEVEMPSVSRQIDYEAELVVIIGKGGKNISKEDAPSHVFGYTCGNDLSARDLQFRSGQWLIGKTLDGFAPTGPILVSADELNPSHLDISTKVNGKTRQSSNTSFMIFDIPTVINYISGIMTLEAGDIIFTGTPAGVIVGMPEKERVWLADGDVVEVTIEKIGTLRNVMKREKAF